MLGYSIGEVVSERRGIDCFSNMIRFHLIGGKTKFFSSREIADQYADLATRTSNIQIETLPVILLRDGKMIAY